MRKGSLISVIVLATANVPATAEWHYIYSTYTGFRGLQQNANCTLAASGSATLSGYGSYYVWVGPSADTWASVPISFDSQSAPLGTYPPLINRTSNPTGFAGVTFELAPEMFKQGTLDYLDLNIKENADWGLDLGSVELQGSLGGTQPVVFSLDATGRIDSYGFTMTGPPTGTYASGAFPSITYDVDPYGTLTASYSVSIAGRLHVEGVFDADLGELLEVTGTVAEDQTLPGTMVLAELPGPYPKDVVLHLTADIGSLDPPFVMSGSYDYTDYSGGTNPYYVIHTEYALAGVLTIGDAHFDVYGPIDVPEPATVGVFALGSLLFVRCSPHTPNRRRGCEFGRSVSSPTRDR